MKKIFYTLFITASAAMGLSSCMNGDYDADPLATATGTNPLNTGGTGGGSSSGSIRCKVGGTFYSFDGKFAIVGSQRTISGGTTVGSNGYTIGVGITNYSGAKTYNLASEGTGAYGFFPISTPSDNTAYATSSTANPGTGTVTVTSDANDRMSGTFSFTAGKINAGAGDAQAVVTEGTFNVPKQ